MLTRGPWLARSLPLLIPAGAPAPSCSVVYFSIYPIFFPVCFKTSGRAKMSSSMSMVEARLPPGFRFHPRDHELVLDYLCHKLSGGGGRAGGVDMVDVDLNKCEPWELPDAACVGGKEWYFFSRHDRKYATGQRTNRATHTGYWKATGKDRVITGDGAAAVVGMRKTLVFYLGRAPRGTKTEWVMHEFRAEGRPPARRQLADHPHGSPPFLLEEDWVLCRVFYKSTTAAPTPASDESSGSQSSEVGMAPALLPIAPIDAVGRMPMAAITDSFRGHQEYSTSLLMAPQHWPVAPLPFRSFRDLLGDMVESSSGDPKPEWSVDDGYTRHSGMPQAWNPF
ncbi:hypothetical protein VPH35_031384 [Triticum aestivum]